jgi:hypothetical protein
VTPIDARQQAEAQAEDLALGLGGIWLDLPCATRRLILATIANPASRSGALLAIAEGLRDACTPTAERVAPAMCHACRLTADALTALAPARA